MSESRLERLAPLTGVVFVALLVAGTLVINNYDFLPPGDELKSFYESNSVRARTGYYLILLSAVLLLWFVGSLRSRLRSAEGGTGRLSAVAFGGGVAATAGMLVGNAAGLAAAVRGGADGGISVEAATALYDFTAVLMGNTVPMGYAVLLGATAVVSFRTGVFAGWLNWVTAVVAIGLLIPEVNFVSAGAAVLWVAVVSVLLYTSSNRAPAEPSPT